MSAKKKAGKKTLPRKKAAKKKVAKHTLSPFRERKGGSKTYTIHLRSSIPCPFEQRLRKHASTHKPDKVRWKSEDGDYTLAFTTGWPFTTAPDRGDPTDLIGNPPVIDVPPITTSSGYSRTFTADTTLTLRNFSYNIQPPAAPHPRDPGACRVP